MARSVHEGRMLRFPSSVFLPANAMIVLANYYVRRKAACRMPTSSSSLEMHMPRIRVWYTSSKQGNITMQPHWQGVPGRLGNPTEFYVTSMHDIRHSQMTRIFSVLIFYPP